MEVLSVESLTSRSLRSDITVHLPSGHREEVVKISPYARTRTQDSESAQYVYTPAPAQDEERIFRSGATAGLCA